MAAHPNRLLVSAILGMTVVMAVNIVANEKGEKAGASLVRREVDLDPNGHVHTLEGKDVASQAMNAMIHDQKRKRSKAAEPTECDRQFLVMADGVDKCTGSGHPEEILFEGDCTHASVVLKIEKAPAYFLHNYKVNPLPYPKGCFLNTTTNKIHFNPEESNTTGHTLAGQKICMRGKYINGTKNTDPSTGCEDDANPILNYDKCWAAALCAAGGGACKLQSFKDNVTSYKQDTRPQGCFKDANGCWGFNWIDTVPTGDIDGTPVCLNVVADNQQIGGGGGAGPAPAPAAGGGTM